MKVKQEILDKVNNVDSRRPISEKLEIGDQMLYKHMKANVSDGPLTKMKAVMAIADEAGIHFSEVLEIEEKDQTTETEVENRA